MVNFFDGLGNTQAYESLFADSRDKNIVAAFGIQPAEKPFVAALSDGFVFYVTSDYVEAQRVFQNLSALLPNTVFVPAKDDVLLFKRSSSKNSVYERNFALFRILSGANAAVTTIEALAQFFPFRQQFASDCFAIRKGGRYDSAKIVKKLVSCGYSRVDGITSDGEFVMRGDILDVSMPFGKRFRVDFFDDMAEDIKSVDETAQQSVDSVEIYPIYDTSGFPAEKLPQLEKAVSGVKLSENAKARLAEILSGLTISAAGGRVDNCWLTPFVRSSRLEDFLPQNTIVMFDEPKMLKERIDFVFDEHQRRVENLSQAGEVLPCHISALVAKDVVFRTNFHRISLQTLPYQSDFQPQVIHNFKTGAAAGYAASAEALAHDVKNWNESGYETFIFAGVDGAEQVSAKLREFDVFAKIRKLSDEAEGQNSDDFAGTSPAKSVLREADAYIFPIGIERGFVSHTNKLAVVGTRDLGRGLSRQRLRKRKKQAFLSVEKGDYVVHDIHGIGLCEGIRKITTPDGEEKDYIVVLYRYGDRLYVPVDASDMLSRYSGGENPALSKIGGEEFARVKDKVKSGIKEMSVNLLKLYAEREKARGFRYHIDSYLEEEFNQYFPFRETEDQMRCMREITKDLTSDRIMDRILVGDVGYGKTEVAMRAAFDVVSNGYQVAVLAPTTILAEQHFNTFCERMRHFDIHVACLNRFRSAGEQKKILLKLANGEVDIVIGTHRLLSKDVKFAKLGLLVLDEEQRFGVEHKEKIKTLKTNVDVLTLSATPIPRTLHMALSGIRDISTITTPPLERLPVETYVVEDSDALVADAISRELSRGGQVFVVYNRVRTIDRFAMKISGLVPQAEIVVAHGQMDENDLEDAVFAFSQGKGNVLVCTTIIENGIDMPNANTLIVYDADCLGLSQLYQLRGRVGRSNRLAYAYFLYGKDKILNGDAYKRLSSITEYSELGSGFRIAMKDLEIRGAGNILGREQHGHMMKVGYEMYARLLKETVDELKGEKPERKLHTELEIDLEAFAPEEYIATQSERIEFYQQLASCVSLDEVEKLRIQLSEVYGALPRPVENLFRVTRLKLLANKASVVKVSVRPGRGEIIFADREAMMNKRVFDALNDVGDRASASNGVYGVVFSSSDFLRKTRLLEAIEEFLQKI